MQGQRSSLSTTLSENLSFDHGSTTSSDTSLDSQMAAWNTSTQNQIPEFRNDTNIQLMNVAEWSLGETSSANSAQGQVDPKSENPWSFRSSRAASLTLGGERRQYEPCSNILSFNNNIDVNVNGNQSNALSQDLNMSSGFEDDDDCQIVEPPPPPPLPPYTYTPTGLLSNEQMPPSGVSSSSDLFVGYVPENEDRPPLDGRRISCKRKAALEGQSSSGGAGSSNSFSNNELVMNNNESERLRLGVGGPPVVTNPPSSLTNTERSRRNFRLRINGLHQQQNPTSGEGNIGNDDISSSSRHTSRLIHLRNRLLDLNPASNAVENPFARRNPQTRWSGASSSRSSRSSSPSTAIITGERDAAFYEERNTIITGERDAAFYEERDIIPRSIAEHHPIFVSPPSGIGSSTQNNPTTTNWNLVSGGVGNVASTSEPSLGSGSGGINPSGAHRSFPRRLSQIVRRSSLLSESGAQNSNLVRPAGSSMTTSQETSGSDTHGLHAPNSRLALLERHLDGAFGMPYSLRALAASSSSEARSGIMSEQIRHVLDLMRRGEGLRFEDMMMLDHHSAFMADHIHDRHRDMRLDVDNMSYEELLALEERIGDVCTGLREETITKHLKQHIYTIIAKSDHQVETEPCSICREEYNDGEDVGTLECGHDFHKECIKQWLMQKNLCPICKTTGLATT